jgi:hypothetical protein
MKNILSLVILALLSGSHKTFQPKQTDYIEIKNIGPEQKLVKPLFISYSQVNIEINGRYLKINNQKPEFITERDSMILSNGNYSIRVIDNNTFQKIILFINHHNDFFTNDVKKDQRYIGYAVIMNGKTYVITYPQKLKFSQELIKFLGDKNCDRNIITALSSDLNILY